jgi:hypothetical protein
MPRATDLARNAVAAGPYSEPMIRHTVAFRLRHPSGSPEERSFLDAATALAAIPGVERFEQLDQVSPKNSFGFGFSMEFAIRRRTTPTTRIPPTSPSCATAGSLKWRTSSSSTMHRSAAEPQALSVGQSRPRG